MQCILHQTPAVFVFPNANATRMHSAATLGFCAAGAAGRGAVRCGTGADMGPCAVLQSPTLTLRNAWISGTWGSGFARRACTIRWER
jgi:hypothetical protein